MSDYLSLLAARLSGAASTLQPRLPSRFEPPARPLDLEGALPGLSAPWGQNEEQVEAPASLSVQTADARPVHAQPASPAPLDVPTLLAQNSERLSSRVEPASQPAPRPLLGPAAAGVTIQPAAKSSAFPLPAPAAPLLKNMEKGPIQPVSRPGEAPTPVTRQASETRQPETAPVRQAIEVRITRASLSLPPDRTVAAIQQPSKDQVTPPVQPASLELPRLQPAVSPPLVAAPPARNNPESSTSLPSTIQVTIGRIEVHAAQAPVVAGPRKSRSAPLMSLEEYLKQRNGEKR